MAIYTYVIHLSYTHSTHTLGSCVVDVFIYLASGLLGSWDWVLGAVHRNGILLVLVVFIMPSNC